MPFALDVHDLVHDFCGAGEVESAGAHFDAELGRLRQRSVETSADFRSALVGMQPRCEAGAARACRLDDGDLEAELRGADGGDVAAGAGADDRDVEGLGAFGQRRLPSSARGRGAGRGEARRARRQG